MRFREIAVLVMLGLAVGALVPAAAEAKPGGCLKYGAAGAVAGHMAGHGVAGAAVGCAVGAVRRHRANKQQQGHAPQR